MTTTTSPTSSRPSGNRAARLEAGERPRGCRHHEPVAVFDHALRILCVDVRVPADDAVLAADAAYGGHRLDDGGMLVLPRIAEVLREVSLANQHDADAFDLGEDRRQVVDGGDVLAHEDDEDLAVGR